jgi:hypothetical protein
LLFRHKLDKRSILLPLWYNMVMKKQPNYAAELTLPALLDNAEGLRYFDLNGKTMMDLRSETFYLDMPGANFRYPHHYARELRKKLWADEATGLLEPARDFAHSVLAQDIMQEEGDYMAAQIHRASENGLLGARNITNILRIGRSTLTDWQNRGEVETVTINNKLHVPTGALLEVCGWHYPETLDSLS